MSRGQRLSVPTVGLRPSNLSINLMNASNHFNEINMLGVTGDGTGTGMSAWNAFSGDTNQRSMINN